jgi:hypothetical protein
MGKSKEIETKTNERIDGRVFQMEEIANLSL